MPKGAPAISGLRAYQDAMRRLKEIQDREKAHRVSPLLESQILKIEIEIREELRKRMVPSQSQMIDVIDKEIPDDYLEAVDLQPSVAHGKTLKMFIAVDVLAVLNQMLDTDPAKWSWFVYNQLLRDRLKSTLGRDSEPLKSKITTLLLREGWLPNLSSGFGASKKEEGDELPSARLVYPVRADQEIPAYLVNARVVGKGVDVRFMTPQDAETAIDLRAAMFTPEDQTVLEEIWEHPEGALVIRRGDIFEKRSRYKSALEHEVFHFLLRKRSRAEGDLFLEALKKLIEHMGRKHNDWDLDDILKRALPAYREIWKTGISRQAAA